MSNGLLSEKYQIIKVLPFTGEIKYLLGRSNAAADDRLVLINEIKNRKWINAHLAELLVQAQDRKIPDFFECFAEQEKLYVTFSYKQGTPLLQWLEKTQLGFTERIEVFCRILEKTTVYQSCPVILQNSVIQNENIVMVDNVLAFNYQLISDYEGNISEGNMVFKNLEILLHTVFSEKELKKNGFKMIQEKCKKNIYFSVGEMIRDLISVTKETESVPLLWTKIMEKKRIVLNYVHHVLFIVICVGAAAYFWNYWHARDVVTADTKVTKIGSVEVGQRQEKVPQDIVVKVQEFPLFQASAGKGEHSVSTTKLAPEYNYSIQWGDTLRDICIKYYGSDLYVQELVQYNHLSDQDLIHPGDTLQLPDKVNFKQAH